MLYECRLGGRLLQAEAPGCGARRRWQSACAGAADRALRKPNGLIGVWEYANQQTTEIGLSRWTTCDSVRWCVGSLHRSGSIGDGAESSAQARKPFLLVRTSSKPRLRAADVVPAQTYGREAFRLQSGVSSSMRHSPLGGAAGFAITAGGPAADPGGLLRCSGLRHHGCGEAPPFAGDYARRDVHEQWPIVGAGHVRRHNLRERRDWACSSSTPPVG
jgi:hypothetical protein